MVYTSLPLYLDPPNWNQQQNQQQPLVSSHASAVAGDANSSRQIQQTPRPQASLLSTARPNSMSERARLAKIPQPEQALKCPRCDSTNTKFCYFNNYSLSQPRHFCKTCRRYWTRGGALRNVPVGGGCRRNKRIKTASKTASSPPDAKAGPSGGISGAIGATSLATPLPQLPLLQSLNSLADYGSSTNLGLNYCGIPTVEPAEYPAASSSSAFALEPWRFPQQFQHLPFFAGIEPPAVVQQPTSIGLYPFDAEAPAEVTPAGLVAKAQEVPPPNLETKDVGVHASDGHWRDGRGAAAVSGTGSATSDGGGGGNGWSGLPVFNSSTSPSVLL